MLMNWCECYSSTSTLDCCIIFWLWTDVEPLIILKMNHWKVWELGRCELPESVSTHKIWVQKLSMVQSKFLPAHDQKIDCGDHLSDHIPISTMSNHTLYLWRDIRRVEMLWNGWIGLQTNNLGVKGRDPSRYFHLPWLKSWGVVMVVGDKFHSQPCLTI